MSMKKALYLLTALSVGVNPIIIQASGTGTVAGAGARPAGARGIQEIQGKGKESPFEACKGVTLLSKAEYDKNIDAIKSCTQPGDVQVLLKDLEKSQDAIKGLAFLQEVGKRAAAHIDKQIPELEKIVSCFEKPETSGCHDLIQAERRKIGDVQPRLRQELALAEGGRPSQSEVGTWTVPTPKDRVNASLSKKALGLMGLYRADDIEPLTPEEMSEAVASIQRETDPLVSELGGEANSGLDQKVREVQMKHSMRYLELLQQAPVLTVIGKSRQSNEYLAKGYKQLLENAKNERKRIQEKIDQGALEVRDANFGIKAKMKRSEKERAKDMRELMLYTPVVEEVLASDPSRANCSTASSLLFMQEDAEARNSYIIMGGAIALGLASGGAGTVGVITGLALGPALGYGFRLHDQAKFDQAREGATSGVRTMKQVDDAEGQLLFGTALAPLDWFGVGVGALARRAVAVSAMKSAGLAEKDIEELFRLSRSADKKIADAAREKINEAVNKRIKSVFGDRNPSTEELELLDEMGKSGALSKDTEYAKNLLDTINRLGNRETQRNALRVAKASYAKLNPNSTTPEQFNAIRASVRFGREAGLWTNWREGLGGVTKTFDLAASKLETPAVAAIANVAAREAAAIDSALDDLMKDHPNFSKMLPEERLATRTQMRTCILGSK